MSSAAERAEETERIHDKIVDDMKKLNVYHQEHELTIRILSQMMQQYRELTERFERGGYKISTKSAQGGMKKAPLVAALESLRKDILAYTDRLCLNPKALDALTQKPPVKKSKLDAVIGGVDGG